MRTVNEFDTSIICPRCGDELEYPEQAEGCPDPMCPMLEDMYEAPGYDEDWTRAEMVF